MKAQLDKHNCNPNNWNNIIKKAIDTEVKLNGQSFFLVRQNNATYFCGYCLLEKKRVEKVEKLKES